jgi:hypothetical protein
MEGVCALLEAVRALTQASRAQTGAGALKNDVYFLFTDGEEAGHLGAKAFLKDNPALSGAIDLVVNLDAAGTDGALLMFETSAGNFNTLNILKSAVSRPITYSYAVSVYRAMPNGTDLTEFINAGFTSLNFSAIENMANTHSPADSIENLNRASAYSFLLTALELSGLAAGNPIERNSSSADGVYFTLLPGLLVLMSGAAARVLAGVAVIAALVWLALKRRFGGLKPLRALAAAAIQLGVIAAAALTGALVCTAVLAVRDNSETRFSIPVFLCATAVTGAGTLILFKVLNRRRTSDETLAGVIITTALSAAICAVFFNAASYMFTFPLLALLTAAALERLPAAKTASSALAGVFILLIYTPACWFLFIALGLKYLPLVAAAAALPLTLAGALTLTGAPSHTKPSKEPN